MLVVVGMGIWLGFFCLTSAFVNFVLQFIQARTTMPAMASSDNPKPLPALLLGDHGNGHPPVAVKKKKNQNILSEPSSKKVKFGTTFVWAVSDELANDMLSSQTLNACPGMVHLALDPTEMIKLMYADVSRLLTHAAGTDVKKLTPLVIGSDHGWTAGWNSNDAVISLQDSRHKYQSGLNVFCLEHLDLRGLSPPCWADVVGNQEHFFSEPSDIQDVLHGEYNPEMLRYTAQDSEHKGLIGLPEPHSIRLCGGHVVLWSFILGIFRWARGKKDVRDWLPAVRSVVVCVHHFTGSDKDIQPLKLVLENDNALAKRAETQSMTACDKAELLNRIEVELAKTQKVTVPSIIAWCMTVSWADSSTKWTSARVISCLREIYQIFVADGGVYRVMRQLAFICGKKFLQDQIWKLDAVIQCHPNLTSSSLLLWLDAMKVALKRGDITKPEALTTNALRDKGTVCGSCARMAWRLDAVAYFRGHYELCDELLEHTEMYGAWDKAYPSQKESDAMKVAGRPLITDNAWKIQLQTHQTQEVEQAIKALYEGKYDGEISKSFVANNGKLSVPKLLEFGEFITLKQRCDNAWVMDKKGKPGSTAGDKTSSSDGGESEGGADLKVLDPVAAQKAADEAQIAQKCLGWREKKLFSQLAGFNAKAADVSLAMLTLCPLTVKPRWNKDMHVRYFDCDQWSERPLRPWQQPKKLCEQGQERLKALWNDVRDGELAIVCCGGHPSNPKIVKDILDQKVEMLSEDDPSKKELESKLKTVANYLVFKDAGSATGQRQRGVASGQNVEEVIIGATSKINTLKKKERHNKSGTTHSTCFLDLERPHFKKLKQLPVAVKQAILCHEIVDVSSMDPLQLPKMSGRAGKRHEKSRSKVDGNLPLRWRSKQVETGGELLNVAHGLSRVFDYGLPDGYMACASVKAGISYHYLHVNVDHQQYVTECIDVKIKEYMQDKESPLFESPQIKELLEKLYPIEEEDDQEPDDESADDSGHDDDDE